MIQRKLASTIIPYFFRGKVIIISGARQTGKTTMVNAVLEKSFPDKQSICFNCDKISDREMLEGKDVDFLDKVIGDSGIIFIDEAQKVSGIGNILKQFVDVYKTGKQVIVTGSSSLNLLSETQEPLTGRKLVFFLYPLAVCEMYSRSDYKNVLNNLEEMLIYGCYPDIANEKNPGYKKRLIEELCSSYLYKDIFEFQRIKNPTLLNKLLRALALQIGSEVSYNELAGLIGIDKNTVERYVDLLEKNNIIFRLPPYSSNKRKEISKLRKIFFYDTGIRNAVINNFNSLDSRTDTGALWENFLIIERLKYRSYLEISAGNYFWRTYNGAEVDLVEERDGLLFGYEFKWGEKKSSAPGSWMEYKTAKWELINRNKLIDFIF